MLVLIGYYVFLFFVQPVGLDRKVPVTLSVWLNDWRYLVQVASFALIVEGLLYTLRRQARSGTFGGRP